MIQRQQFARYGLYFWIGFFVLFPLLLTLGLSFTTRDPRGGISFEFTFSNLIQLFDSTYIKILFKSLRLAALTSFLCAIFGFPIAYVIATSTARKKLFYYALLLVPFWTNFIVRTQALRQLLSPAGLNLSLDATVSVQIGMLMNYLPLFVLPCAVAIERLPASVWEAAEDLGAHRPTIWMKVIFPILKKPLFHGSLMVFVPALGEFVIPDILGGAQGFYLGGLISEQFLKARNWPFGAALSLLLLLSASLIVALQIRDQQKKESA